LNFKLLLNRIALKYHVIWYSITLLYDNTTYGSRENMNLKNLVTIRKQKNWSQEKLAVESGISYNTIIKIERGGIKNPKIETVIKLADALDITLDELIGRKHL